MGYFDPIYIYIYSISFNINKIFWGDLTDVSAKPKTLLLRCAPQLYEGLRF